MPGKVWVEKRGTYQLVRKRKVNDQTYRKQKSRSVRLKDPLPDDAGEYVSHEEQGRVDRASTDSLSR
jgi:hypothetical protein